MPDNPATLNAALDAAQRGPIDVALRINDELANAESALRDQEWTIKSLESALTASRAEVEALRKERDEAVAFASKVERAEVLFKRSVDAQLQAISEMPLGKTANENLSDSVARVLADRDRLAGEVEQARKSITVLGYSHQKAATERDTLLARLAELQADKEDSICTGFMCYNSNENQWDTGADGFIRYDDDDRLARGLVAGWEWKKVEVRPIRAARKEAK